MERPCEVYNAAPGPVVTSERRVQGSGSGFRGFGGARLKKNRGVWQDTRHQNCFGIKYDKIELRALFSVFSSLV